MILNISTNAFHLISQANKMLNGIDVWTIYPRFNTV